MSVSFITQGAGAGLGIPITVALPAFPNVPNLPGVPALPRSLLFPPTGTPSIGSQALPGALFQTVTSAPVWGVFDNNNNQIVIPDSVMDFGWRQELRVSNFPVQAGQFANYNRVVLPFESSVIMTKGGSLSDRRAFLQQIDAIAAANNIELYTIKTPEKTYSNVTVTRAELTRRGKDNAFFFDVEVFFTQVIQVSAQYSASATGTSTANASTPSAIPTVNQGLSNASTPTAATQAAAVTAAHPGSIGNLAPWWTS